MLIESELKNVNKCCAENMAEIKQQLSDINTKIGTYAMVRSYSSVVQQNIGNEIQNKTKNLFVIKPIIETTDCKQ